MIKADIKKAKLAPCQGRVHIALHWVEPNARRDYGNIRAGEKFISDALVSLGILNNMTPPCGVRVAGERLGRSRG